MTVSPGPDGLVSITAVEHGSDDRTQIEIGQEPDGTISARTNYENRHLSIWLLGDRPNKVDFTVVVPAQTDLTVKCVSANTHVHGVSGDVRLKSVNGLLHAADLSGDLHLESVSGRIEASRLSGPTALRTVSGGVTLTDSDLPALDANSVSGSMDLETPMGEGPYELRTVSGSVRIRTGDRPTGRIHFRSLSGSASVDSTRLRTSENVSHPGPKKALFELSENGPDIHFRSVSGSLKLVTKGGETAKPENAPKTAPASAPASPGRMEILERIASGEISVDEAVAVMRA